LLHHHAIPMAATNMDDMDYADMVEQSPVRSQVIEYQPAAVWPVAELVGACLTDQQSDGM
jgi:arginine-tRNA-protein transferase